MSISLKTQAAQISVSLGDTTPAEAKAAEEIVETHMPNLAKADPKKVDTAFENKKVPGMAGMTNEQAALVKAVFKEMLGNASNGLAAAGNAAGASPKPMTAERAFDLLMAQANIQGIKTLTQAGFDPDNCTTTLDPATKSVKVKLDMTGKSLVGGRVNMMTQIFRLLGDDVAELKGYKVSLVVVQKTPPKDMLKAILRNNDGQHDLQRYKLDTHVEDVRVEGNKIIVDYEATKAGIGWAGLTALTKMLNELAKVTFTVPVTVEINSVGSGGVVLEGVPGRR